MVGTSFVGILALSLTITAVLGKKPFLSWVTVPLWVMLGIYVNYRFTWFGSVQWLFVLLGFGMAAGMVIEAILTQRKESLANLKEDDQLMKEDEENWTDEDVDKQGKEFKLTKVQKRLS